MASQDRLEHSLGVRCRNLQQRVTLNLQSLTDFDGFVRNY